MSLGKRLKLLREKSNLNQKELADKLNIPNQSISNYERDYRQPDYENLLKLADFYSVSTDFLLGRSPSKIGDIKEFLLSNEKLKFDNVLLSKRDKEMILRVLSSLNYETGE